MTTYQQQVEWELAGWGAFFAGLKDGEADEDEEEEGEHERTHDNENNSNQ